MLFLTFTAGPNRYAVNVVRVVEIVPRVELRPIPHAPPFLVGLLGYRGKAVPVIDLSVLLGAAPCRDRLSTRIILVNQACGDHNRGKHDRPESVSVTGGTQPDQGQDQNLLGLTAERVSELTRAQPEQMMPAPVHLLETPYLEAIIQTDQGILQLIAVEKISKCLAPESLTPPGNGIESTFVDIVNF